MSPFVMIPGPRTSSDRACKGGSSETRHWPIFFNLKDKNDKKACYFKSCLGQQ